MDVFAKHKKRDHILREFFLKNDGKTRLRVHRLEADRAEKVHERRGEARRSEIKLDKDEDREKSIRRFCVTLYQNVAWSAQTAFGELGAE